MRAFWNALEIADRTSFLALDKLDESLGRPRFRARSEKAIEHVRPPQKAITFEK